MHNLQTRRSYQTEIFFFFVPAIQIVWVDSHQSVKFLHLVVDCDVAIVEQREECAIFKLQAEWKERGGDRTERSMNFGFSICMQLLAR